MSSSNSCSPGSGPSPPPFPPAGWDLHHPGHPSSLWPVAMLCVRDGAPGGSLQTHFGVAFGIPSGLGCAPARMGLLHPPGFHICRTQASHAVLLAMMGTRAGPIAFLRRMRGTGPLGAAWPCLALIPRHVNSRGYFLLLSPPSPSLSLSFSQQRSARFKKKQTQKCISEPTAHSSPNKADDIFFFGSELASVPLNSPGH